MLTDQLSSQLFLLPFPQLRSSVPLHRPSPNRNSRAKEPAEAILWHRESDNNLEAGAGVIKKKRSPVLTSRGFPSTKDICRNHETLKSVSNKLWSWLMWDLVKEEMTVNWADQWEGGRDETGPGGWPFYFCIPVATCTRPSHLSLQVLQQLNPPPWKAFSSPFLPSAHWVPPTHCSVLFQGQLLWGTLWPPRTC